MSHVSGARLYPSPLGSRISSQVTSFVKCVIFLCFLTFPILIHSPAHGHEFRPGLLDIRAIGGGRYDVLWNPPPESHDIQIVFDSECSPEQDGNPRSFVLNCGESGLAGRSIRVTGAAPLRDEVLVRLWLENGSETSVVLSAAKPDYQIPVAPPESDLPIFVSYAFAGAHHFATGFDHLFFVIALVILLRASKRLVAAVTAFTVAHSVTLFLQVTGSVQLPTPPVEATIALSVVLLAREIAQKRPRNTLLQTYPWLAAFGFGLLHGLGFAGGLRSFGVSQGQILPALFGFNVGLEMAQLALVALAIGVAHFFRQPLQRPWTKPVAGYSLGAISTFWLVERTVSFWSL
ncbi:MAG: HupE/UreJ family protein [Polyangiaceae bacterium]|nr:HupE/UreJ family protein [Polyangiaceae bacterium]